MADIRCPMCGRANPEDLKECQYCQARLTPMWDSGSAVSQSGPPEGQDDDLPEWLKSLRVPQDDQSTVTEPEPEDRSVIPDWLSNLREQPVDPGYLQSEASPTTQGEGTDDDTADWLQRFLAPDSLAEAEEGIVAGEVSEATKDEADWLSRIDKTPVEEERPGEPVGSLDWMTDQEPEITAAPASDQRDVSSPPQVQPGSSAGPLLDWLTYQEAGSSDQSEAVPDQPVSEIQSSELADQFEEFNLEDELPAWLFEASSDEKSGTTAGDADVVDFGEEITEGTGPRDAPFVAETFAFTEGPATGGESLVEPAIELPPQTPTGDVETSSEVETSDEVSASPEQDTAFLAAAGAMAIAHGMDIGTQSPEEDLSWLDELETTYGDLTENASEEQSYARQVPSGPVQAAAEGLPEWLISDTVEGEQASEESLDEQGEIKPAEVPSWLQAMRPVGVTAAAASVLGPDESQQIEGAGPLAGLRGALPAEPDISKVQKPPVYSIKLQVTDAQQLQAELLRGLIDSEDQAEAFSERSTMRSQRVMRLLIAVFLIVPLIIVLVTGIPQLNLPAVPPEVDAVGKLIDGVQPGSPVLLAIDYQPGFSGEMDTITAPVLQHLFDRGAYLAAVSTVATGPVQAEHLFNQMRVSDGAPVQSNASYANLGYIPGGATGLLAFAQSPQTVLPANLEGAAVWESPALQPVDSLSKFAMLVVSTDNPDVARTWIEQVQPYLGATPLVMVLSAQAEPVVRPYFEANPPQVQGVVGGLAGGAAYLSRSARSGAATRLWSPFGAGVLIAVILMVLAGLANLVSARASRQKPAAAGGKGSTT